MNALLNAAAAVTLVALSMPASAQELRQTTVSYGDLDLTHAQGVARLKQRVKSAIRSVCADNDQTLKGRLRERSCVRTSSASADQNVARVVNRATQAQANADVDRTLTIAR